MKTSPFLRLAFGLFFLPISSTLSLAQISSPDPAGLGYWNLETNLTTRAYTLVRFYNGQDQLVYEERLPGLCLDLSSGNRCSRRTTRQLTATLHQVLRDAAARQSATLLARQFGSNRRIQRAYAFR